MKKDVFLLMAISLLLSMMFLVIQRSPGYMDAEYHTALGYQISESSGFNEPFIWNYLDNPTTLVHPSHTYWMPLTSLISAAGFVVIRSRLFFAARLPFILISAFVPVLTYFVALKFNSNRSMAFLAALLSIFSGFYAVYSTIPDSFGIYMICGGSLFLLFESFMNSIETPKKLVLLSLIIGSITGIMHLSRTEGFIWFICTCVFLGIIGIKANMRKSIIFLNLFFTIIGYFSMMVFWYLRNINVFGTVFPPGNSYPLLITIYDQIFSFNPNHLNFTNWSARSLIEILKPMAQSLAIIFGTLIGVQTMVFLLPLYIIGRNAEKKKVTLSFFSVMMIIMVILMGLIFPFAGMRGGYLHTSAAFQPIVWALCADGIFHTIPWFKSKFPNLKIDIFKALRFALFFLALTATIFISGRSIIGNTADNTTAWSENQHKFQYMEIIFTQLNIPKETILAITNPPGLFWETGRSAVVTPFEGEKGLAEAAARFNTEYVILETNHLESMHEIYINSKSTTLLEFIGNYDYGIQIYRIQIEK